MSKTIAYFFRVLRSTLPHSPRFHFSKSTDKLRESINNTANASTFLTFSLHSFIDYTLAASVVNPQRLNICNAIFCPLFLVVRTMKFFTISKITPSNILITPCQPPWQLLIFYFLYNNNKTLNFCVSCAYISVAVGDSNGIKKRNI